jgi:hypothetical protein
MKTLIIVLSALVISTFADEKKVTSDVVNVTIFKDRALVIREAFVDLAKGQHTLIFSDITTDIKDESVRINVPGFNAKILDVKIERRFTTQSRRESLQNIDDKIDKLQQEDKVVFDRIEILNSKKEFVDALKAESGRYYSQTMLLKPNAQQQWNASLQFIDKNLSEIYSDIRHLTRQRVKFAEEIRALEFEKEQVNYVKSENYKEIIVKIEVVQSGRIELQPTYLVNNASWYPTYDARVDTRQKRTELSYYAMVQQTTGEDWQDINLTLSTADPVSVTSLPKLEKWVLDTRRRLSKQTPQPPRNTSASNYSIEYNQNRGLPAGMGSVSGYVVDQQTGEPLVGANLFFEGTTLGTVADINGKFAITNVDQGRKTLAVKYIGYEDVSAKMIVREKYNAEMIIEMVPSVIEGETIMVTAQAESPMYSINQSLSSSTVSSLPVKLEFSDAYTKALSTVFALKTKNDIPSDNNAHKITVFKENLEADFNYMAIPKINPKVFLKGKMINSTTYPLLEGELNVFVDNDFVNRAYLGIIVPTDTLELALGVDEGIQVDKSMLKRFVESKGLLGNKKRVTYDLEIRVKNNKTTNERIEIKDQLPDVANEDIKVELLKPAATEIAVKKNNELIWNLTLKAGEERVIPIKYYVEFPADLAVYGLE